MIKELVNEIKIKFFAFPGANDKQLADAKAKGVSAVLLEFYSECDGCFIGFGEEYIALDGNEYQLKVLKLSEVENVQNYGLIGEDCPLYTASKNWWQCVTIGGDNFYVVDESSTEKGRILDVPHEEVGFEGCHAIIAESFSELLQKLIQHNGKDWFGIEEWKEKVWV